jgi:hypothetical protein
VVEVGTDDNGGPITSCAIVPVEGGSKKRQTKLGDVSQLALNKLHELIAEVGEPAPASNHIPPGARICSATLWRETFYRAHPAGPDRLDTKRKAFDRAVLRLQELGLIGLWSDRAWLPDISDMSGQI